MHWLSWLDAFAAAAENPDGPSDRFSCTDADGNLLLGEKLIES